MSKTISIGYDMLKNPIYLGSLTTAELAVYTPERDGAIAYDTTAELVVVYTDGVWVAHESARTYNILRGNAVAAIPPTAGETPNLAKESVSIVRLTSGITEFWTYTGGAWALIFSQTPAVLDGNNTNFSRTDSITGIVPTALEIPSPISGDTAIVFLLNGTREYYSYNGTAWALNATVTTPENNLSTIDLVQSSEARLYDANDQNLTFTNTDSFRVDANDSLRLTAQAKVQIDSVTGITLSDIGGVYQIFPFPATTDSGNANILGINQSTKEIEIITPSVHTDGNIRWVSVNGDDTAAQVGNMELPYGTIEGAIEAAKSGETVAILPGSYNEGILGGYDGQPQAQGSVTIICIGHVNVTGLQNILTGNINSSITIQGGTWDISKPLVAGDWNKVNLDRITVTGVTDSFINVVATTQAIYNVHLINSSIEYSNPFIIIQRSGVNTNIANKDKGVFIFDNCKFTNTRTSAAESFIIYQSAQDLGSMIGDMDVTFNNCTIKYNVSGTIIHPIIRFAGINQNCLVDESTMNIKAFNTIFLSKSYVAGNVDANQGLVGFGEGSVNDSVNIQNCIVNAEFNNVKSDFTIHSPITSLRDRKNNKINIKLVNFESALSTIARHSNLSSGSHINNTVNFDLTNVVSDSVPPQVPFIMNHTVGLKIRISGDLYINAKSPTIELYDTGMCKLKNLEVIFKEIPDVSCLVALNKTAGDKDIYCQSVVTNTLLDDATVIQKLSPILRDANLT